MNSFLKLSCLLLGVISLFACQSAQEKFAKAQADLETELKNSIQKFLQAEISSSGEDIRLQDIVIHSIDTLTPLADSIYTSQFVLMKADYHHERTMSYLNQARTELDLAILSGPELREMNKRDAERSRSKAMETKEKSDVLYARFANLDSLISNGLIDSTTATGFMVNFDLKATDGANVARDLVGKSLIFDMDRRIVLKPEQEFFLN